MKTYKERTESILQKAQEAQSKNKQIGKTVGIIAAALVAVTALNLALFLPYSNEPVSVAQHQDSKYYTVIKKLNEISYKPPMYKNNFEKWTAQGARLLDGIFSGCGASGGTVMDGTMSPPNAEIGQGAQGYVETTDNQVAGVIEGDLLKRTDEYIFYFSHGRTYSTGDEKLLIYSIAGEDTALVSQTEILPPNGATYRYYSPEMYLSQDGDSLYFLQECYARRDDGWTQDYTIVSTYDVSNPTQVALESQQALSGYYVSSRMIDGQLFVITSCATKYGADYSVEADFIPQYGEWENMQSVAAENIHLPQTAKDARYTVVYELGGETLSVQDSIALLSYSTEVYVSGEHIFVTHEYAETSEADNLKKSVSKTEISCISYAGDGLELKGSVAVDGRVKNQYAMDEYQGILRVVTTTEESYTRVNNNGNNISLDLNVKAPQKNASLYCVDLSTFEIVGSVENFAPDGESAESVRFDGDKAYVCTAEIVVLTDPVYAFNLSNVQNITYVDTGVIAGYSTSLVNFTDGYLLGVGYDGKGDLKIEIYRETESDVESVCAVEYAASFSEDYKSYFIDRERGLIGLGVLGNIDKTQSQSWVNGYLLFQFDGNELTQVLEIEDIFLEGENEHKRATLIDGYFYMFSGLEFNVVPLFTVW